MRKFSLVTILILFLLLPAFSLYSEAKVKVGVYQNEPKVFVDSTGRAKGVFVDIIEHIAAKEGWSIEYVLGTWDQGLNRLVAGEIDLMVDVAYSEERTRKFSFQQETVLSNWAQVYVSKGSDIQSILDLKGKKVAGLRGDMSYGRFTSTVEQFGIKCQFIDADEFIEIFRLVDSGAADAGIMSHFFGLKHENEFDVVKSPIVFNPMELRFASARGENIELLEAIDRHLVAMKSDSSSTYHKSINKWLATELSSQNYIPNWVWWLLGSALGMVALFFLHHVLLHKRVIKMTTELRNNNEVLQDEIAVREKAEDELTIHKGQLEDMVTERTSDLRESEERYRSIFENATMGIFRTTAAGRILTANPAGADILGYESVEDLIETITDLAQQLYANPEERKFVLKLMQEQGKATLELDLLRKNGSVVASKLNMWTVTDNDGNLRFLEGFIEDITERKEAEEKLRLYHRVFMASTDGISMIDMDGNTLEYNSAMLEAAGYNAEEYRKIRPLDLFVEEDAQKMMNSVREIGSFHGETRFRHRDGTIAYVDMSIFPIINEDGTISCLVGIGHNVTERKLAEEKLQRSEKKYRELVQNANSIILRMDVNGRITFFNEFAQSFFGYTEEEILGQNMVGTIVPEQESTGRDLKTMIYDIIRNPNKYGNSENENIRRDGKRVWIAWANRPIYDSNGNVSEILCIGNDISELKQARISLEKAYQNLQEAQSRLIQSEKMASLGMLVAGIAHEFNNPISAVQSANDTLESGIAKFEILCDEYAAQTNSVPPQAHKILAAIRNCQKVIEKGTERVASIVQRMKTFARLDEAEMQQADLNQNLRDTAAVFKHELKSGVILRMDLQELPTLRCSPARLNQLFIQLLRNANQACGDNAEILICSRVDRDAICIAISDTGIGIPQEDIDRIFDPGYTTRGVGIGIGLGLGLPICYQIAQEHNGRIDVESSVGSGSTFSVILPLDSAKLGDI